MKIQPTFTPAHKDDQTGQKKFTDDSVYIIILQLVTVRLISKYAVLFIENSQASLWFMNMNDMLILFLFGLGLVMAPV